MQLPWDCRLPWRSRGAAMKAHGSIMARATGRAMAPWYTTSNNLYRITELLHMIKYGNRGIFYYMTLSVVDHFFRKTKTPDFPDKVDMGRVGVGVRVRVGVSISVYSSVWVCVCVFF